MSISETIAMSISLFGVVTLIVLMFILGIRGW